jgi:hypothetical protein
MPHNVSRGEKRDGMSAPKAGVDYDKLARETDWGHERKGSKDPWSVVDHCVNCGPLNRAEFDNGWCSVKIAQALERARWEGKAEEMENLKNVFVSQDNLPDWWAKHEQFLRKRLEELKEVAK